VHRVLVTGATGQIGSQVVDQLAAAGYAVRALTRRPEAATLARGVEVVCGNLTQASTLEPALRDADAVFLVWVAPLAGAAAAIERIASPTRRIVFLSAPHRTPHPFFQQPNPIAALHAGIERLIEASGARWTVLRPHAFAINARNWWAQQIRTGDVVRWFHGDAATAPIHERDVAAAAVRALCEDGHDRQEYVLTGPESLTQREQVQIIGEAIGRRLRLEEVPPDTARRELLGGWPPAVADMLMNAYAAAVGLPALVTSTMADVTGAPARSFREWTIDHRADFTTAAGR